MRIVLAGARTLADPGGDRPAWSIEAGMDAIDPDNWARMAAEASERVTIVLAPEDVLELRVPIAGTISRRTVAAALVGRTPLALRVVNWDYAVVDEGEVRVTMARRERIDRLTATMRGHGIAVGLVVGGTGETPLWRAADAVARLTPVLLLALLPLLIGLGAWAMRVATEARVTRLQLAMLARARTDAAAASTAALFARPAATALLRRLEAVLPDGATLHAVSGTPAGAVDVVIDAVDPGSVRAALANDAMLARFRTVGQDPVADRGIRMRLRLERP